MVEENRKIISEPDELNNIFKFDSKERYEYRDRTLLSKMGFQDNDLKTKRHDEMLCTLADSSAINALCELLTGKSLKEDFNWKINIEFPIITQSNYIVGFIDIMADTVKSDNEHIVIMIEIKTLIDNIGELLRQINVYKQYMHDSVNPVVGRYYEHGRLILERKFNNKFYFIFVVVSGSITEEHRKLLNMDDILFVDVKELEQKINKR